MELWSWILRGILGFITALGNGGVIFLITTRRRLHTTANWFVLSLAVADFSLGVFFLPLQKIAEVYPLSKRICYGAKFILAAASITNLCVMTLDRYIRIVHPLRYVTFMKPRRVGLLISAAWVTALIRPLFHLKKKSKSGVGNALLIFDSLIFHIIPCIVLLLATIVILLIVRRQKKQSKTLEAQLCFNYPRSRRLSKKTTSSQTRESVFAKVMVAVVAMFVFTFGTRTVAYIKHKPVLKIFNHLVIMNSAANPIAYAVFKTDIRKEIRFSCKGMKAGQ